MAWVPFYIWEHWAGLAEPVEEAWAMKSIINPMGLPFLLGSFYYSHKYSDHPTIVKVGIVLYFGFMFGPKANFGFEGSPKKTYDEQIAANSDPTWNSHHLFLHIWYLTILWVVALTVPYNKLCAIRVEKSRAAASTMNTGNVAGGYSDVP